MKWMGGGGYEIDGGAYEIDGGGAKVASRGRLGERCPIHPPPELTKERSNVPPILIFLGFGPW